MTEADRTMLALRDVSKMSPASIAMVLGRGKAGVEKRLAFLDAQCQAIAEPVAEPEPPVAIEVPKTEAPEPAAPVEAAPARVQPKPAAPSKPRLNLVTPDRRDSGEVRRVTPITDTKRRFVRRFLTAGWRPCEVAWLFDLEAEELADMAA